jgi:putative membrane protein
MVGLLIRWLVTAVALWLTSQIVSGIRADGFWPLFFAAIVLGILNALLRPLVLLITLPINFLSFGLFTFVINGLMLKLTGSIVGGFSVEGFWAAVGGAFLLSFFSFLLNLFINDRGRIEYLYIERIGPR